MSMSIYFDMLKLFFNLSQKYPPLHREFSLEKKQNVKHAVKKNTIGFADFSSRVLAL